MKNFNEKTFTTCLAVFLFFCVFPSKPINLPQRPILITHGLSGACADKHFVDSVNKYNLICLETGAYYHSLAPYSKMAQTGCQKLKEMVRENPDKFANGFYLITFSNGGLVARHLILRCPIFKKLVRRVIDSGTPHLGLYYSKAPLKLQIKGLWNNKRLAAHAFYRKIVDWSHNEVDIIDNVNDDRGNIAIKALAAEETAKKTFLTPTLEVWINLSAKNELYVPHESVLFGSDYYPNNNTLTSFTDTETYKQGYLKLNTLYNEGRYMNCIVEGDHAKFSNPEQEDAVYSLLRDNCTFDSAIFENHSLSQLYKLCFKMKITHGKQIKKLLCDPTPHKLYHHLGFHKEVKGLKAEHWHQKKRGKI